MPTVNPRMGYSGARAKDNRVCLIERTSMYIQLSFSVDLKRSSSKFSKMFLFFLVFLGNYLSNNCDYTYINFSMSSFKLPSDGCKQKGTE